MNEKINELVDKRLKDIFSDYPDNKDLNELEAELRSDLIASAEDKLTSEMTEQEAVAQAFKTFGDIDEVITQVLDESQKGKVHINQKGDHFIDINDDGIKIDNGKILNINDDGISINNGKTIELNEDGIKIGKMRISEDGIDFGNGKKKSFVDFDDKDMFDNFDDKFKDVDFDTEINVESLKMTNERSFSATDIEQLDISYDSAAVKLLPTSGDKIILREYMSRNNPKYQAKVDMDDGTLTIIQGQIPHFLPLKIRVQVLIPRNMQLNLSAISHSGNVELQKLDLKNIKVSVHSGLLNVRDVNAESLLIKASSGKIVLEDLEVNGDLLVKAGSSVIRLDNVTSSNYVLEANSGTIKAVDLNGGGQINAKSGIIKVDFGEITKDISIRNSSGTVRLNMPSDVSYNFDLEASSGIVKMNESATYKHDVQGLKEGIVGTDPSFNLTARVKSGTIKVD